jgi:hypothetical protein
MMRLYYLNNLNRLAASDSLALTLQLSAISPAFKPFRASA